jgi:RsiW-degrading membrane proteinase PrsW (M82 family)
MFRDNRITKHHEISQDCIHWSPLVQKDLMALCPAGTVTGKMGSRIPEKSLPVDLLAVPRVNDPYVPPQSADSDAAESADSLATSPVMGIVFKAGLTPWIVFIGLGPLVFGYLQAFLGLNFVHIAWLFSAYFCALWAWILGSLVSKDSAMWQRGVLYTAFTAFIGILMLFAWQAIPFIAVLYSGTETVNPMWRLLGFVFGVGVLEELCKVTPLLLFGLRAGKIHTAGDGLFLGMMSGLGFAMSEGVDYTIKYWSSAVGLGEAHVRQCVEQATNLFGTVDQAEFLERLGTSLPAMFEQYGVIVVAQLTRFMSLPLLHAAWAGIVGYGAAKGFQEGKWGLLFAGLGVAAVLHGLYNFYSPSILSLMFAALSILLTLALLVSETRCVRAHS